MEHSAGNGALCILLNKRIYDASRIDNARFDSEEVSLDGTMEAVYDVFNKESSLTVDKFSSTRRMQVILKHHCISGE